jgi:hypothetical protein
LPGNQIGISTTAASAAIGTPTGVPTKDGGTFSFAGWNTDVNGTGDAYAATGTVPAQTADTDYKLYAIWSFTPDPTYHSVTYNKNLPAGVTNAGDITVPADVTAASHVIKHGDPYTLNVPTGTPRKADGTLYEFAGWADSANGEVKYPSDTLILPA